MDEEKQHILEEQLQNNFSWIRNEVNKQYFRKMPEHLIDKRFFDEVNKLPEDVKKYLLRIENRGRKVGESSKVSNGQRSCNGPLCKGKEHKVEEFANSYCKDCDKYKGRFGIKNIFIHIDQHSESRQEKNPQFSSVGEVSAYIRLEAFFKMWEQGFKCAISGVKLEDFTGLINPEIPDSLTVDPIKDRDHWTIDRKDRRKGYVFGNIQIITRYWNEMKGAFETIITNKNRILPDEEIMDQSFRELTKQLKKIYADIR